MRKKGFAFLITGWIIVLSLVSFTVKKGLSQEASFNNNSLQLNYLKLVLTKNLNKTLEKIYSLIDEMYSQGKYEGVINVYKKIPFFMPLKPEARLKIAKSYLILGQPQEAIKEADKILSLRLLTQVYCEAEIVKLEALAILNNQRALFQELRKFQNTFCYSTFKDRVSAILYFLHLYPENQFIHTFNPETREVLKELFLGKTNYLLSQKQFDKAYQMAFYYINVFKDFALGKKLVFNIAEAYFHSGQIEKARTLYRVILTLWRTGDEATLSKFRLYQIAYQKIKIKELVPEEMIKNLLFYCSLVKKTFPYKKIGEEAAILEIQILDTYRMWDKLEKATLEFMKVFRNSSFVMTAKRLYCKAITFIFQSYYKKGNFEKIFDKVKKDWNNFHAYTCGYPFYIMGKIYNTYNLWDFSKVYFSEAYRTGLPQKESGESLLFLTLYAFLDKKRPLFDKLLNTLNTHFLDYVAHSPWYYYVNAIYSELYDLSDSNYWLNRVLSSKEIDEKYKKLLLNFFRDEALKKGNLERAFRLTMNPYFKPDRNDFLFLLVESFDRNPSLFEKILNVALEKFPDDREIKWLAAYFYERQGEISKADKFWREIGGKTGPFSTLAESYKALKNLIEKTHQLIF